MRSPHHHHAGIGLVLPALLVLATCFAALGPMSRAGADALAATPNAADSTLATPDPASPFGVAGVMRWPDWGTFDKPAGVMLTTGGSWVREDFAWGLIEPRKGEFDWTATDRIVSTLKDKGLSVLGIISYSAAWATPTKDDDASASAVSMYPPDLGLYYSFVHTLAARYKGSVTHWEVWNEPNSALFWKPAPDARQYAELLKTAYRAVKDVDPGAIVMNGGLAGNGIPFLEEMEAAGAGGSYDVLAIHAYATPLDPSLGPVQSMPEVYKTLNVEMAKYRAFLQRHGHDRPLWVTEMGWPAANWSLNAGLQADYLAQAYALVLAGGMADRVFWYSFKDSSASGQDSWGLLSWGAGAQDLEQHRPSFAAYATSARMLAGTTPAGRLQLGLYDTLEAFEQAGLPAGTAGSAGTDNWTRSTGRAGSFALSSEQKHTGASSGKLQYEFTGPSQAVDFAPPSPVALPGKPTRLGIWVRGDASGDYLSAWLRDRDGELFKVMLGAVTGAQDGWRYYDSAIQGYYFDWEKAGGNPSNGIPDYPLQFVSLRLENTPDEPAGAGTIYVDDLQSYDGPGASAVRFTRPDGMVVDVLWSDGPEQVTLPTGSTNAQVTDRDGVTTTTIAAQNGLLSLGVGSSPVYVVHKPQGTSAPAPTPVTVPAAGPSPHGSPPQEVPTSTPAVEAGNLCEAAARTVQAPGLGNRYFPETGHNLSGAFRTYWEENGGVELFGYPITDAFVGPSSDGKNYTQQLFERARMEYHPENNPPSDVQLGLLGVWATRGRTFEPGTPPTGSSEATFFPQTGQSLDLFKPWWNLNGGLAAFGFPLSGELQERNSIDGKTYTVQYFERNRLEYHPEFQGTPHDVMLGLLGVEYLAAQNCK